MKELSLEQKAKAYDEAKYIMEEYLKSGNAGVIAENTIKKAFPELKESEDEKIRGAIIHFISHTPTVPKGIIGKETMLAWLEKQGNLMKALQISNAKIGELIEENYYLKEQLEKQRKNNMGISEATKQKLEDNLNKALEKETPESCNEFLEKQGEPKKHDVCDNCEQQGGCVSPCPMKLVEKQGEQNPVIKMKTPEESLGIDSDIYNKIVDECVYGEQKPVVILKFRVGDTIKNKKTNKIFTISDYSLLYEYYHDINHYHEIKFSEQDDWELVEQNPAWGEEDERMCKAIIDNIQAICEEGYFVGNIDSDELIKWLKYLKDRYTWKPSGEQMLAINTAINVLGKGTINGKYLIKLQEQLKKLREK